MKKYTERINRRLVAIFAAFCLLMASLSVRLYTLATSDRLMQTAQTQRVYTLRVLDERGMIYDSGLQPLVAEGERYRSAIFPTPGNQQAGAVRRPRGAAGSGGGTVGNRTAVYPSKPTSRLKRRWSTASRRPTDTRRRRRPPT